MLSITQEKAAGLLFTVYDHATQENVMFMFMTFPRKVYDFTDNMITSC